MRILVYARLMVLLGIAAIVLLSGSCDPSDLCRNELLKELKSPNGANKVVIFQRDCGATTGFSTQISILSSNEKLPNAGGDVFIADTNHGAAPSSEGGGPVVEVTWIDDNNLLIKHDSQARVSNSAKTHGTINISYATFPH